MHAKILQTPSSIRCKNTAHYSYIYLYGHEQTSDFKSPASFHIRIFICTDTNNLMIANHPHISANENHVIQKSRLMSLSSIYSPIKLYIRRYTRTNSCIKTYHKSPPYNFHYHFYVFLSSEHKTFCHNIHKNSSHF